MSNEFEADDEIEIIDPLHVLLVEDDALDARTIQTALRRTTGQAFEFHVITHLKDLPHILETRPVDIILLDLDLPDSTGFDTAVRGLQAAPGIPIVILSGQADYDIAKQALVAGAQVFQEKHQLSGDGLAERIGFAIERKQNEITLARQYLTRRNNNTC